MIGVEWQIGNGCVTSVMGLAPFATMPVTRRAPYVCLAAWPGGHDNPHWTRHLEGIVHFLDTDLTALQLTTAKYRSLAKASTSTSEGLWQSWATMPVTTAVRLFACKARWRDHSTTCGSARRLEERHADAERRVVDADVVAVQAGAAAQLDVEAERRRVDQLEADRRRDRGHGR